MERQLSKSQDGGALYAVYGTLRRGFGNHRHYLDNEDCEYLGQQHIGPGFKMVSLGGFPGVIPDANAGEVVIEVFRVNSKDRERALDGLEGYPRFYGKIIVDTKWGKANMYTLDEARYGGYNPVPNGDWKEYKLGTK